MLVPLAVLFLVGLLLYHFRAPDLGKMPTPQPRYPWFGNLFCFPSFETENFFEWHRYWTTKLGKTWAFSIPIADRSPGVLTSDPRNVEHILRDPHLYVKGDYIGSRLSDLLGQGIFIADGAAWERQRKLAARIFTINNYKHHLVVFEEQAKVLLRILDEAAESGKEIDIQNLFFRFTMACFCQIAFGVDLGCMERDVPFSKYFDSTQSHCIWRFMTPAWQIVELLTKKGREHRRNIAAMNKFALDLIKLRRSTPVEDLDENDLLGQFFRTTDEKGEPFSDNFLRDVVMNFLLAGRDTTAGALTWAIYELAQRDDVCEKISEEVAREGGDLSYDAVGRLAYVHAVCSETLRLHPSVPVDPKIATRDDVLPDGTFIRRGTSVAYMIYVMGRDPDVWQDPDLFDPERFTVSPPPNLAGYQFPVFNAGKRTCLGQTMAMIEMKTILSLLIPRYSFTLLKKNFIPTMPSITLSVSGGLQVTVERK